MLTGLSLPMKGDLVSGPDKGQRSRSETWNGAKVICGQIKRFCGVYTALVPIVGVPLT